MAVGAGATVSATKTAGGGNTVGATVTYTVTLNNAGPGTQGDNPGDEFTDVLPADLALVSASATSGTAVATTGTNTVTWNGSIPSGGSVTITITATILPSAAGKAVSNQGTFVYDADGNGTNESSGVTDDPGVGGSTDPTTIAVAAAPSVLEIPTLSAVGLAALALLLAAVAVALLLRRRRGIGTPAG